MTTATQYATKIASYKIVTTIAVLKKLKRIPSTSVSFSLLVVKPVFKG